MANPEIKIQRWRCSKRTQERELAAVSIYMTLQTEKSLETLKSSLQNYMVALDLCNGPHVAQLISMYRHIGKNQHKIIHAHVNATYLCLKATVSLRAKPGPAMKSHSTPPQVKHRLYDTLCFPNVQFDSNSINLKTMILKITLPCPCAPEECSHRRNQWKTILRKTNKQTKGLIMHKAQNLAEYTLQVG